MAQRRLLAARRAQADNADDGDAVTMIVVGAGACVLPSWLVSVSPRCRVSAVEYSSEVVEAARHRGDRRPSP